MGRMNARVFAALLLGAGACRGQSESAVAYEGPFADEVREAIPAIERTTGLRFTEPPTVAARTSAQVRAFLASKIDEERPARELAGQSAAYKRLGLLPDTMDVRATLLDLLAEQVIGFYDPATKVLYAVDGSPPELLSTIITHELVHALQDQYISLDSLQAQAGDNDRILAAQSVIEGMATYNQLQIMLGVNDIASRLPGGWEKIRETIRSQSASMPLFASAPLLLQETLIFPYLSGAEFVRRYEALGDSALLARLPLSTEQVIHDDAYELPADMPTRVTLPAIAGAADVYQNNLGEFETRIFLYQHLRDQGAAVRGAAGWDGDRYAHFQTAAGEGIVWVTVWDTQFDAGEFFDLMDQTIARRFPAARPLASREADRSYTANGRRLRVRATEIAGRAAILFADVPGAMPVDLLPVTGIQLDEPPSAGAPGQ